tara:strand:+ start:34 stop:759 length:726 start_codon:yes stop_codon:yes gene_type:complete
MSKAKKLTKAQETAAALKIETAKIAASNAILLQKGIDETNAQIITDHVEALVMNHGMARSDFASASTVYDKSAKSYARSMDSMFTFAKDGVEWIDAKGNSGAKKCGMTETEFEAVKTERAALKSACEEAGTLHFDSKWQFIVSESEFSKARADAKAAAEKAAAEAAAEAAANDDTSDDTSDETSDDTSEKTDLQKLIQHVTDALRFADKEDIGCALTTRAQLQTILDNEKTFAESLVQKAA